MADHLKAAIHSAANWLLHTHMRPELVSEQQIPHMTYSQARVEPRKR